MTLKETFLCRKVSLRSGRLRKLFDSFPKETFDSLLKETFTHLLSGLQRGRMCFFFSCLETLMKLS